MSTRRHAIFTGTGRAGTTFIIALLTKLGLDTGYTPENLNQNINKNGRAGLEGNIREPNAPYIVKSPYISDYIREILDDQDICIDHVFIPIRDINEAVQSRVHVSDSAILKKSFFKRLFSSKRGHAGGLTKTTNPKKQEAILLNSLTNCLVELATSQVPITFINYPKLTQDPNYLFEKLNPILKNVSFEEFKRTYTETVKPEWVHSFKA